eukprot:gene20908-25075_t
MDVDMATDAPDVEADRVDLLLERFNDCGLAKDLTVEDLRGAKVSPPFRSFTVELVQAISQLTSYCPPDSLKDFTAAQSAVSKAASTADSASGGRLERALARVLRALDAATPPVTVRLDVLEQLVDNLQAFRLVATPIIAQSEQAAPCAGSSTLDEAMDVDSAEPKQGASPEAFAQMSADLRALHAALHPNAQSTVAQTSAPLLMADLAREIQVKLAQLPANHLAPLLRRDSLSPAQLARLSEVHRVLQPEYTMRRDMLIKRVTLTLQSFMWSKRAKDKQSELSALFRQMTEELKPEPNVVLDDVFRASI